MCLEYILFAAISFSVLLTNAQYLGPMPPKPNGCNLNLKNGFDDMEPKGSPLILHVKLGILGLRDVPDSGGSFGVDVM